MRLLDLFSGAGGCAAGYAAAGFDITAIDIAPQPHYPFLDIAQGDALIYLQDPAFLDRFDVVHASPPCQAHTALRTRTGRTYTDLIPAVRDLLRAWGGPYVIENVVGADLINPITLCGSMFDLGRDGAILKRHRLFESNVELTPPGPCRCAGRAVVGVYGAGGAWQRWQPGGGGNKIAGADAAAVLGVTWTHYQPALSQMIPPAYTEHLGRQLIRQLAEENATR